MKVTVLLFAAAREAVGQDSVSVNADNVSEGITTIRIVRSHLLNDVPQLQRIAPSLLWSVNNEYATDEHTLREGDVVACFPPVSGG